MDGKDRGNVTNKMGPTRAVTTRDAGKSRCGKPAQGRNAKSWVSGLSSDNACPRLYMHPQEIGETGNDVTAADEMDAG